MAKTASILARVERADRGDPLAEARRVVAEAAPTLAERLVRIATDDRHPRQLDAIRLGLAYAVGQPALRVEARIERAEMRPEEWAGLRDVIREATAKLVPAGAVEPILLSGEEAMPTPERIDAATRQLATGQPSRGPRQ